MKKFSINQVEEFTGVRKHTLRIWEKRYSFVRPGRTKGKLRSYSLEELQILLDIILLYQNGEKISKLATIKSSERDGKIEELNSNAALEIKMIYKLIMLMYASDIEQFERLLDEHVSEFGIHKTLDHILIPFLGRVKLFSYEDDSPEVHFVVTAIRKKIISGIEQLGTPKYSGNSALLFLPEEQYFDLTLLYMAYMLKKSGVQVWYLGTSITIENLQTVLSNKQPSILVTYLCPKQKLDLNYYYNGLNGHLDRSQFLIATSDGNAESMRKVKDEKFFQFSMILENISLSK